MSKFIEKTAVISGGAEGIGLSIAKALGEQKMNIVLADINEKNLQKASLELETLGIPVLSVVLDVAKEDQWQEVAERAIARFGKIHMIVNNAGIGGESGLNRKSECKRMAMGVGCEFNGCCLRSKSNGSLDQAAW